MAETDVLTASVVKAGTRLPPLEVPITARTVIQGASASRDWQPQHHDRAWAVERAGTRDIFLNTPTQAGWIERYLTDWTGPRGRLGRLRFRMRRSIYPGETLVFRGVVREVSVDDAGCSWADVDIELTVEGELATECSARIAIPKEAEDNPWTRDAPSWKP
jgi:acyl dehydratase